MALNQSVHVGAKRTTPLAGPAGGAPRHSRGQIPESPNKSDRKAFSRTVCATIGVPSGCALLRISQNVYPCMGLTAARTSSPTKRIACHAPDTITGQDGHRQNAGVEDAGSGQRRADVPPVALRSARGSAVDAAEQRTLMPTDLKPLAVAVVPGLSEAHKPLPEARVAWLAAKGREAADMAGGSPDPEIQLARDPLEVLPQPSPPAWKSIWSTNSSLVIRQG